ncbi:MAG: TIR domain-containing protein [Clostridia bacterium]|nr:TIR domain-containing protein [Clostridia bacterium]
MSNFDVFISYSHKDKDLGDAICHYLESDSIKCWMAPRDIVPGEKWAKSIAGAIPKAKVLLLVFSSHSNVSDQVLREVELAISNGKIIVPVRVEDIKPTGEMEYYLSTVHWIEIIGTESDSKLKQLSRVVQDILESGARPNEDIKINSGRRKRHRLRTILIIILAAAALGTALYFFRDSLLGASPDESQEPVATDKAASAPTPEPTSAPTPEPTALIDPNISPDTVINIPDFYLRSAIMQTLEMQGQSVNGSITAGDMLNLERLRLVSAEEYEKEYKGSDADDGSIIAVNNDINSLEGLQYAQNLKELWVGSLGIKDISPLSQIGRLETLDLSNNLIEDISPLAYNTNLISVWLFGNDIKDIEPLAALYKAENVGLDGHNLMSVSTLLDMPNLKRLYVIEMGSSEAKKVLEITQLEYLYIVNSSIDDLSPLLDFENLEELHIDNIQYQNNIETIGLLRDAGCEVIVE